MMGELQGMDLMGKPGDRIVLRLVVEAADRAEAERLGKKLFLRIKDFGHLERRQVQPCGPLPRTYEVVVHLSPSHVFQISFEKIMSSIAEGWDCHGADNDRWAVWQPTPSATCFLPNVRQATLEAVLFASAGRWGLH
jgi:hypothetical protein